MYLLRSTLNHLTIIGEGSIVIAMRNMVDYYIALLKIAAAAATVAIYFYEDLFRFLVCSLLENQICSHEVSKRKALVQESCTFTTMEGNEFEIARIISERRTRLFVSVLILLHYNGKLLSLFRWCAGSSLICFFFLSLLSFCNGKFEIRINFGSSMIEKKITTEILSLSVRSSIHLLSA